MTDNWFRNTTWNDSIAKTFEAKLGKARRKEQYLRIQACTLARSHPLVALELLERYFALPDDFDHAQAHVDRGTALLALDRLDDAIEAYEAALAREAAFPKLQTQAYLNLPYLVATRRIRERFGRALELLEKHKARLTFPVDRFRWHACHALISAAEGDSHAAMVHARHALVEAERDHSGFRYHSTVGLVTDEYKDVLGELQSHAVNHRGTQPDR